MRCERISWLLAAAVCGLLLVSCGDDSDGGAKAPATGQDAAAVSSDGVLGAGDATTVDSTATSDSSNASDAAASTGADASTGKCGNGTCDAPDETLLNCAQDCAGGANCGDGKCNGAQENGFTCPKDCKTDPASIVTCIMKGCTKDVLACMLDADCGKALGCIQGCKEDIACMGQCGASLPPATQQKLGAIVLCGGQQGCFGIGGSGGKCGDGKCDGGIENQWTCEKDCPKTVCGDGKCNWPIEQFTCAKDCPKTVCGDGKCEQAENALNCAQDCVPKTCGDGKCDKPDETMINCIKDCQPGNAQATCITTKCGKEGLACGFDFKCGQAAFCTSTCTDKSCFETCGAKLPSGSKKLFDALKTCGETNSCFK
jgi:hypothetical protein